MSAPTWEMVRAAAESMRAVGGVYGYVAAALEHDHEGLRPRLVPEVPEVRSSGWSGAEQPVEPS